MRRLVPLYINGKLILIRLRILNRLDDNILVYCTDDNGGASFN